MYSSKSITVLTFPERADLYRSIVGPDADFKLRPNITAPLDEFLTMIYMNHGSLVVIDEGHFIDLNGFKEGIKRYVDNPVNSKRNLRLIFVCADRKPGDELLSFLSAYCSFYDIVYDVSGIDISVKLEQLINKPNTRFDVLKLLESTISIPPKKEINEQEPISITHSAQKSENEITLNIHIQIKR